MRVTPIARPGVLAIKPLCTVIPGDCFSKPLIRGATSKPGFPDFRKPLIGRGRLCYPCAHQHRMHTFRPIDL